MDKQTQKIIEAYKFAMTETARLWKTDRQSAEYMTTLASLAYLHLLKEGADPEKIMSQHLNLEDDQ